MKKLAIKRLTLDLDGLQVESFELAPSGSKQRGTVKAYATDWNCPTDDFDTMRQSCLMGSCAYSCDTCDFSCEGTCGDTTCYGDSCVCWTDPPYC
jgi:hypothetical protein